MMAWDPFLLAEPGQKFIGSAAIEEEGYDGQFALYIALEPTPEKVSSQLDVPAFRYQRILLPLISRILGLGQKVWIPWTIVLTNLAAHILGTYFILLYCIRKGIWTGYSLVYGLWVGLVAGIGLDLNEPIAFAFLAGALLAWDEGRGWLSAALVTLSLFSKETSLPLWAGFLLAAIFNKTYRKFVFPYGIGGIAYAGWQLWLFHNFGETGLVSGGEGATSFEWIPFNGLWKIGSVDVRVLLLYLVIFGPTILFPTIWALVAGIQALLNKDLHLETWLLLVGGLLILFLPFSSFREPLALVRLATGLVFGSLVFAARHGTQRVLRYGLLWCVFLVLLNPG
jgi:hypothetical protein